MKSDLWKTILVASFYVNKSYSENTFQTFLHYSDSWYFWKHFVEKFRILKCPRNVNSYCLDPNTVDLILKRKVIWRRKWLSAKQTDSVMWKFPWRLTKLCQNAPSSSPYPKQVLQFSNSKEFEGVFSFICPQTLTLPLLWIGRDPVSFLQFCCMLLEVFSAAENIGKGMSSKIHQGQDLAGLPPASHGQVCKISPSITAWCMQQAKPRVFIFLCNAAVIQNAEQILYIFFKQE